MSKLLDLVAKIEDEELKKSFTSEIEAYKKDVGGKQKLELEKLELKLKTEQKSVENLTIQNDELKKTVENGVSGEDADKRVAEMQLKFDKLKLEKDEADKLVSDYKGKEKHTSKVNFSEKMLKDHKFNLPKEFLMEKFTSGLIDGANEGSYLATDSMGNQILPETYTENFIEEYKQYYVAPGSDTGGSGEAGGQQANTGGFPKSKDEFMKLPEEKRNELAKDNISKVKELMTS